MTTAQSFAKPEPDNVPKSKTFPFSERPQETDPYFAEDYLQPYEEVAGDDPEDVWRPPPRAPVAEKEMRALMERWVEDPVAFAMDVFAMKPREWQPDALRSVRDNRRTAIKACRKAGKTALSSYVVWWWLVTRPYSLVMSTAPTWSQVHDALWVEIHKLWRASILPHLFPKWYLTQVGINTGVPEWRAFGVSSDRPERIEGPHGRAVLIVYDEAKAVTRDMYDTFQGMLADAPWREIAISTPGAPNGWFYDAFTKDRNLWNCISLTSKDIPRLHAKYELELGRLGPTNATFRRQQLAEFAGAEEGLFRLADVEAAVNRDLGRPNPSWKRIMGVDPAGTGTDECAVCLRFGPAVLEIQGWVGWDEMDSVKEIARLAREWNVEQVIVEKPGIGSPMASRLKEMGVPVELFVPQAQAYRTEDFADIKTEIAYGLRERLTKGEISLPADDRLITQLTSFSTQLTGRGLTKMVDPKGSSPDRADALLIAFAQEFIRPSVVTGRARWL